MPKIITLAVRAILSPDKIFRKIADITTRNEGKTAKPVNDKFFIDGNGSIILNRNNADVQKAFADNVAGLTTKKNG